MAVREFEAFHGSGHLARIASEFGPQSGAVYAAAVKALRLLRGRQATELICANRPASQTVCRLADRCSGRRMRRSGRGLPAASASKLLGSCTS
ncbi:hypothetical protein SBBP2_700018 [Burkholderiales bacterium]|nr:hypothetical protein SBBP2_700018 [Burkholderiales bacterium]